MSTHCLPEGIHERALVERGAERLNRTLHRLVVAGDGQAQRGGLQVREVHALHDLQEARLDGGAVVLVELLVVRFFVLLIVIL
jgi:hypothetical protein